MCICVCVCVCVCVWASNETVEIASNQSFEGLLIQICVSDDVYFLSSTDMHAVSTCNYENVSILNIMRTY